MSKQSPSTLAAALSDCAAGERTRRRHTTSSGGFGRATPELHPQGARGWRRVQVIRGGVARR